MEFTKSSAKKCLSECKRLLEESFLPTWDELPEFGIYMDQVIEIVNKHLSNLELFYGTGNEITRPMINNYVKLNLMPAPQKKKYSRIHLVYIIVICTLKQSLNMNTIQKLLPTDISEEEVKSIYNLFVKNQKKSFFFVLKQADKIANPILSAEDADPHRINDLIMQIAFSANIYKCLTEKITEFNPED